MLTLFLHVLYRINWLKKAKKGYYFCDPEMFGIDRITFRYIPIKGKKTDNIKDYCGNWHRITLIKWQIDYLTYKRQKKKKIKFP